ncbi:transcriptional regulator, RpiR family [Rhizobiales bacterium GAS188]|nr:transcriptional regulator, RpiR family [Rhizobiales bacterium GAS188]
MLDHLRQMRAALTRSEQRVADAVLAAPEAVTRMALTDVARRAAVSEPTILRFSRSLGCSGFPDFKIRLAQSLVAGVPYVHQEVELGDPLDQVVHKIVQSSAKTLIETGAGLDAAVLGQVVAALGAARRIDCYGVGASGIVALDAQQKLMRLGLPTLAYPDTHLQTMSAVTLRPGDVALCFSHTGAIKDTVRSAGVAAASGATVVAVTRSGSPLAAASRHLLAVDTPEDTETYAPMTSRLAHLVVVDILSTAVALAAGADAIAEIRRVKDSLADRRMVVRRRAAQPSIAAGVHRNQRRSHAKQGGFDHDRAARDI